MIQQEAVASWLLPLDAQRTIKNPVAAQPSSGLDCHWFCCRKTAQHTIPIRQLSEGSFQVPLAEGKLLFSTQGRCHYSATS